MAGLRDYTVANSYADLLTVLDRNAPNTGLDTSPKRVFDGEGISSPLFLSTTAVEIAGALTVSTGITLSDGSISSGTDTLTMKIGNQKLLSIKNDGTIRAISVAQAPTNPQAGDLVNLNGHLYMAV